MTSTEMIKDMLERQKAYDEEVFKKHNVDYVSKTQLESALFDELGELMHAQKSDWCWWKKSQAPVDNEKVLGELVDIWHFILSWQNHFMRGEEGLRKEKVMDETIKQYVWGLKNLEREFGYVLTDLPCSTDCRVEALIAITEYLGFEVEQVYKAYCEKNKVNYQRLKEGY